MQGSNIAALILTKRWPWYAIVYSVFGFIFLSVSNVQTLYSTTFYTTETEREANAVISFISLNLCIMVQVMVMNNNYVISQYFILPEYLCCGFLILNKMP